MMTAVKAGAATIQAAWAILPNNRPRPHSDARGRGCRRHSLVPVRPAIAAAPSVALMFPLMLDGKLIVARVMLVLQFAMELAVFPPRQPLLVSRLMLVIEVLVVIFVLVFVLVVLALVSAISAIGIVAVTRIAVTAARSDRD